LHDPDIRAALEQSVAKECRSGCGDMPEVTAARSITVTTGTYVEVIEAVQRDALDSMATLFVVEPEKTSGGSQHCRQSPPAWPTMNCNFPVEPRGFEPLY
jgi:hypothetical protein